MIKKSRLYANRPPTYGSGSQWVGGELTSNTIFIGKSIKNFSRRCFLFLDYIADFKLDSLVNSKPMQILFTIMAGVLIFLIGFFIGKLKSYQRIKKERSDALKRSRAVLKGQVGEQVAPFLPNFPANASEVRFIGKPVDFIAFNGADEGRIDSITFIEVKTGNANLSPIEKSLKECIHRGCVNYIEYRIN